MQGTQCAQYKVDAKHKEVMLTWQGDLTAQNPALKS